VPRPTEIGLQPLGLGLRIEGPNWGEAHRDEVNGDDNHQRRRRKMRAKRLIAASGVTGLLLVLTPSFGAHAGPLVPHADTGRADEILSL